VRPEEKKHAQHYCRGRKGRRGGVHVATLLEMCWNHSQCSRIEGDRPSERARNCCQFDDSSPVQRDYTYPRSEHAEKGLESLACRVNVRGRFSKSENVTNRFRVPLGPRLLTVNQAGTTPEGCRQNRSRTATGGYTCDSVDTQRAARAV